MSLLRANALLKGFSGVRTELIDQLLAYLNHRIHPVIPQRRVTGGERRFGAAFSSRTGAYRSRRSLYEGARMPTAHALEQTNLQPAVLTSKEGLALINGTQAMTAMGLIAYLEAEKLAYQSERIASLTIEGLQGIIDAFDEDIHAARGYQEQMDVAERIRYYLSDSKLTTVQGSRVSRTPIRSAVFLKSTAHHGRH